jgi:hypothetical protein
MGSVVCWNGRQLPAATLSSPTGCSPTDPQLVCYSWITGIADVAQVAFVRKRPGRDPVSQDRQSRDNAVGSSDKLVEGTPIRQIVSRDYFLPTAASAFPRIHAQVARTWGSV